MASIWAMTLIQHPTAVFLVHMILHSTCRKRSQKYLLHWPLSPTLQHSVWKGFGGTFEEPMQCPSTCSRTVSRTQCQLLPSTIDRGTRVSKDHLFTQEYASTTLACTRSAIRACKGGFGYHYRQDPKDISPGIAFAHSNDGVEKWHSWKQKVGWHAWVV